MVRKKGKVIGEIEGILVSGMMIICVDNVVFFLKYRFDYCYKIINKYGYRYFFEFGDFGLGVYLLDGRGNKKFVGIVFVFGLNGDIYVCRIEYVIWVFELLLYDVEELFIGIVDEILSLFELLIIRWV